MPVMKKHALFVDLRKKDDWGTKVKNELLSQVNQFPEEWQPHLKSGTQITAMPRKVASEFVVYVTSLFATQNASFSLPVFVVQELAAFFATKNKKQFKKKMKAFTKALATATRYESFDDFLNLFARLCGCYTMSGRVKAMNHEGGVFAAKIFMSLRDLNKDASKSIPTRVKSDMQKIFGVSKYAGYVGFVGLDPVLKWLDKGVYRQWEQIKDRKLTAAVDQVLETLSKPYDEVMNRNGLFGDFTAEADDVKVRRLLETDDVLSILANLYQALHWDVLENIAAGKQGIQKHMSLVAN